MCYVFLKSGGIEATGIVLAGKHMTEIQLTEKITYRRVSGMRSEVDLASRRKAGFGVRGTIKTRSNQSVRRLVEAIATHSALLTEKLAFITLTYGKEAPDWATARRHFKAWRDAVRRLNPDMLGFWVSELQKRGAPHFHLLVRLPLGTAGGQIKSQWLRISGNNGSFEADRERYGFHIRHTDTLNDGVAGSLYLAKVLTLEKIKSSQQGTVENRGRTWGYINRNAMLEYQGDVREKSLTERELENWIRTRFEEEVSRGKIRLVDDVDVETGEVRKLWFPRLWHIDEFGDMANPK